MEAQFELILVLLALAAGVTAVSKKLGYPYPIALVIVGAVVGLLDVPALDELKDFVVEDEIFRFAIISLFLPTLLGEATLKLPFAHLRENKGPILALALGGTLISYVVVGFLGMYGLGLPMEVAFVFAALMAATDPVSVISIFKSMGVDHRLATIMEGESLVNDGVAVVLFKISHLSLAAYLAAGVSGLGLGLLEFAKVSAGGVLIGAALAFLFSQLTKLFDDYPLEILFSMILFYSSFFIAEHFHVSGVIAVVVAGLIYGNYGAKVGMSPTTKLNLRTFWDVAALIANSLVFLMVGLEIARIDLNGRLHLVLLAIVIVLLARSLSVYGSLLVTKNISWAWKHVFNWGGLRGSLSIALALSLPHSFAGREDVLVLAFGVVLFSLVGQGITIKPLLNGLGVNKTHEHHTAYEQLIARIERCQAGRRALTDLRDKGMMSAKNYEELDDEYRRKLEQALHLLEQLYVKCPELQVEQRRAAQQIALYAEHDAIDRLAAQHVLSDAVAEDERRRILDLLERDLEEEPSQA